MSSVTVVQIYAKLQLLYIIYLYRLKQVVHIFEKVILFITVILFIMFIYYYATACNAMHVIAMRKLSAHLSVCLSNTPIVTT